jgi:hypothetical protein
MSVLIEGVKNVCSLCKRILEIVLSPVLKRMETEILEFPLSHQYNNKT